MDKRTETIREVLSHVRAGGAVVSKRHLRVHEIVLALPDSEPVPIALGQFEIMVDCKLLEIKGFRELKFGHTATTYVITERGEKFLDDNEIAKGKDMKNAPK